MQLIPNPHNPFEKYKDLKLWFSSSDNTGCGHYRTKLPSRFLNQYFQNVTYTSGFPPNHPEVNDSDVYFLQRITHEHFFQWIPWMQSRGKKIIVDMDDNLWEIPATNLAHRHYPPKELKKIEKILSLVDGMTVSTKPMKDYLSKFCDNIWIVPNMIEDVYPLKSYDPDKPLKLGWAGSYTHNGDFPNHLVRCIEDLVKKKRVASFTTFGFTPQYFKHFAISEAWCDADAYMDKLHELDYDLGVIVTTDNEFNRCKSNLKFLEYSAISCASVAHNVYPYTNSMTHGEDCFLVNKDKTDWPEYLNFLIDNPEKRIEMVAKAHEYVKNTFTYNHGGHRIVKKYIDLLDFLFEGKTPTEQDFYAKSLT